MLSVCYCNTIAKVNVGKCAANPKNMRSFTLFLCCNFMFLLVYFLSYDLTRNKHGWKMS